MKKLIPPFVILVLSVSLGAQTLAELAKSEKARRESLKGRHAVVIRQADLMRVKKVPAVEITNPDMESGGASAGEASSDAVPPAPLPEGSAEEPAPAARRVPDIGLETEYAAAKDMVDLLTTKMNVLRQQYAYQDAMVPGYVIQEQLAETEKRLLKAQDKVAQIEAQIKAGGSARKIPTETGR